MILSQLVRGNPWARCATGSAAVAALQFLSGHDSPVYDLICVASSAGSLGTWRGLVVSTTYVLQSLKGEGGGGGSLRLVCGEGVSESCVFLSYEKTHGGRRHFFGFLSPPGVTTLS